MSETWRWLSAGLRRTGSAVRLIDSRATPSTGKLPTCCHEAWSMSPLDKTPADGTEICKYIIANNNNNNNKNGDNFRCTNSSHANQLDDDCHCGRGIKSRHLLQRQLFFGQATSRLTSEGLQRLLENQKLADQNSNTMNLKSAIIYLVLMLVIVVACVGVFKVYQHNSNHLLLANNKGQSTNKSSPTSSAATGTTSAANQHKLRLVTIFQRHADRGPNDGFQPIDRHREVVQLLWPNGISNLTDTGRLRAYRIGQTLRKEYRNSLDLKPEHVLALSSPLARCVETSQLILRGLFTVDQVKRHGLEALEYYSKHPENLPQGSGYPSDWRRILVDTHSVPSLKYRDKFNCNYFRHYPAPLDSDLMLDPKIKALPGISQLSNVIKERYGLRPNYSYTGLWSTISAELNVARTKATFDYTDHFRDWVDVPVKGGPEGLLLYDLLEQVTLVTYVERLDGLRGILTLSPTLKSLIQAQMTALERPESELPSGGRADLYKNKRFVMYTSHDSVLQAILFAMGIIDTQNLPYADRFAQYKTSPQIVQFLNGLRMSSMGLSFRFELWEIVEPNGETDAAKGNGQVLANEQNRGVANETTTPIVSKLEPPIRAYVAMQLYNEEDGKFAPIDYKPIEIGSICRKMFATKYPNAKNNDDQIYLGLDEKLHCPFELFRNLTAALIVDDYEWEQLC